MTVISGEVGLPCNVHCRSTRWQASQLEPDLPSSATARAHLPCLPRRSLLPAAWRRAMGRLPPSGVRRGVGHSPGGGALYDLERWFFGTHSPGRLGLIRASRCNGRSGRWGPARPPRQPSSQAAPTRALQPSRGAGAAARREVTGRYADRRVARRRLAGWRLGALTPERRGARAPLGARREPASQRGLLALPWPLT